ncbi:Putative SOS response-associated peptidase YedK (plasmid) [Tautonia plasticadhaerens]|uniref:Abasic site processing protein n=2 Tax=Tautonia plasticadhaerens TaxID=2527974 RepID=A0A518HF62_9BACT|nr:Putative SOS response-associated peptidase YedK [Tautonia plasticadhaerens]QDV39487.1 Putative SOS response-associated peptidase YedK [Tautonia plasticadhaerens]
MINARAETVAGKPAFRSAFKHRRCLVPASGFFEWRAEGRTKTPHYFRREDDEPFAFAGLWERWSKGPAPVESVAIITTEPNDLVAPVHDRMPAILRPEDYAQRLDPEEQASDLHALLAPFPAGLMAAHPVGTLVGSPRVDRPECIEPVAS